MNLNILAEQLFHVIKDWLLDKDFFRNPEKAGYQISPNGMRLRVNMGQMLCVPSKKLAWEVIDRE